MPILLFQSSYKASAGRRDLGLHNNKYSKSRARIFLDNNLIRASRESFQYMSLNVNPQTTLDWIVKPRHSM